MSGWNYRMFVRKMSDGSNEFFIGEAYYDDNDKATSCSADPVAPRGESKVELIGDLTAMLMAINQPILNWDHLAESSSNARPTPSAGPSPSAARPAGDGGKQAK